MKNVIAIDIGGTNVRVAVIDHNFEIVKVTKTPTVIGDKAGFLKQVKESIDSLEPQFEEIVSFAVGVPGVIGKDGVIKFLANIKLADIPLKSFLETAYKLPVIILNDAEMAALGEGCLGAGKGAKSSYFVTLSTGLGGAFVSDGLLKKVNNEIGHTLFPSGEGLIEMENRVAGSGIARLAEFHHLDIHSAKDFFHRVRQNDPLVAPMFETWKKLLTDFFNFLAFSFEPEMIILGGGLLKSKDLFYDSVREAVRIPLVLTKFGDDAGLMGAAYCAFNFRLF